MIYRGEVFYGPEAKTVFLIYGSEKYVTEATMSACNKYSETYAYCSTLIISLPRYVLEKIKGYIYPKWSGLYIPKPEDCGVIDEDQRSWSWFRKKSC